MKIPINIIAGWTPDLSLEDIANIGGLKVAKNILPISKMYKPIQSLAIYNNNTINGTSRMFCIAQDLGGANYNFLATTTKLYRFTKTALTDVTRLSGDYTGTTATWRMAEYGNWLIATNFSDDIQVLKGYSTANFIALGGSPPKAKYCLLNNDHLILAHLNEGGSIKPKKLIWSSEENIEDFTPSLITGAGYNEIFYIFFR